MSTYKIVRFYQRGFRRQIETGLTLEEAQAHCKDPQTSYKTATGPEATKEYEQNGPWFDGYEEE